MKATPEPSSFRIVETPKQYENLLDYDFIQVEYEAVLACLRRNYDFWTIISGAPGSGKSTLGLQLALITQPDYAPERGTHYDTASFIEALIEHERGSTEMYDEAIQGASGKDAMTTDYKALEATGEIVRGLNHHAIMCIPRFWGFGPYWRNSRADAWIHVERRGRARVHYATQNLYSKDDAFWNYVCTIEYPTLEGTSIWDRYDAAKQAYIKPAIRRRLDDVRAKTNPDLPPARDEGPDIRSIAEEVAANPGEYKRGKGYNKARIELKFGVSPHQARRVAEMATEFAGSV